MISASRWLAWIHRRDEIVRVLIAAGIGTVLAWITYELVFWANPLEPRATTSWFMAFPVGVVRQHHLHRSISFPKATGSDAASLGRDVVASIGILVFSTSLNYLATGIAALPHRAAWAICAGFVAGFEFVLMKFFVFRRARRSRASHDEGEA